MSQRTIAPRWFQPVRSSGAERARMYLFHHGGGAAGMYAHWAELLPADVSLVLVQLPGRHDRRAEPAFTTVEPLLDALLDEFAAELDSTPYVLFGHSMGGMLAYRLALALAENGYPMPSLLGVSSWAPKGYLAGAGQLSVASDDELVRAVFELGTLPPAVRDDPDVLQVVLPTLRADLAVYADYVDDGRPVPCPVAAYGAVDDQLLEPGCMRVWAGRTDRFLGLCEFPGGHFYLDEHAVAVAADLIRHLRRLPGGRP